MFKEYGDTNFRLWHSSQYQIEKQHFSPLYWQQSNSVIGSAQGRGTTWFVKFKQLECALRHYRRGGLLGKLIKENYLFLGWQNSRAYQELMLLDHLRRSNVNVPTPIAALVTRQNLFFYSADIITEKVANAKDLYERLKTQPVSSELYRKIGYEIKKMHQANVNHTDLNIHNILIDENDKVWIIDFDKCFIESGHNWQKGNLSRLKRSFEKERLRQNIDWKESNWLDVINGYENNVI